MSYNNKKDNHTSLTKAHSLYRTALYDRDMYPVIAFGSAGTGKTYGAVEAAVDGMWSKRFKRIVVTRPNVSFAGTLGLLPGTAREKIEPWVQPVIQNMKQLGVKQGQIDDWESKERLIFEPLEHIQGLTFDDSIIIVDEVQNMSFDQLRVFLTRIGKYSKVVLCGDIAQTSPLFKNSGLEKLLKLVDKYDLPVHTIHFNVDDIVRSEQCKMWVEAFEAFEENRPMFQRPAEEEEEEYDEQDAILWRHDHS